MKHEDMMWLVWKARLDEKNNAIQQLIKANTKLLKQKQDLEKQVKQLQQPREPFFFMSWN